MTRVSDMVRQTTMSITLGNISQHTVSERSLRPGMILLLEGSADAVVVELQDSVIGEARLRHDGDQWRIQMVGGLVFSPQNGSTQLTAHGLGAAVVSD